MSIKNNSLSPDDKNYDIIIKDLVKKYDDIIAVNGLNLEIKSGELFSLLGPNGAGKTTTINVLSGLLKPTSGSALIGSYDVKKDMISITYSL